MKPLVMTVVALALLVAGCRGIPVLETILDLVDPVADPAPPAVPVPALNAAVKASVPWTNIVGIAVLFGGAAFAVLVWLRSSNMAAYVAALGGAIIIGILCIEFWLQVLIGAALLSAAWFAPSLLGSVAKVKETRNGTASS